MPTLFKGRQILGILSQKQPHRLIDQLRNRFTRLRSLNPQGLVQVGIEKNKGSFL
jgi:hypothetical protein